MKYNQGLSPSVTHCLREGIGLKTKRYRVQIADPRSVNVDRDGVIG